MVGGMLPLSALRRRISTLYPQMIHYKPRSELKPALTAQAYCRAPSEPMASGMLPSNLLPAKSRYLHSMNDVIITMIIRKGSQNEARNSLEGLKIGHGGVDGAGKVVKAEVKEHKAF